MSIRLQDLRVRFKTSSGDTLEVLSIDNLEIPDGAQICIMGKSGGGKSTLLNVLAGIVAPNEGKVEVEGTDVAKLNEAQRDRFRAEHIGYVFQSFNLLQGLTARENVAIAGTFAGMKKDAANKRADELLDRVGLEYRKSAFPGTLSVGEQQRVGIARALIAKPKLVLADEPTANLDEGRTRDVLDLLSEVVKEEGATLVLVTHEPNVMARFDDTRDLAALNAPRKEGSK